MFRILATLIVGLLAVYMSSCGPDTVEIEDDIPVNFVSATPPGGEIAGNGAITLTFDNEPTGVTSTAGNITVVGKTVLIEGPFKPGTLDLTVTWIGGSKQMNFYVTGV